MSVQQEALPARSHRSEVSHRATARPRLGFGFDLDLGFFGAPFAQL